MVSKWPVQRGCNPTLRAREDQLTSSSTSTWRKLSSTIDFFSGRLQHRKSATSGVSGVLLAKIVQRCKSSTHLNAPVMRWAATHYSPSFYTDAHGTTPRYPWVERPKMAVGDRLLTASLGAVVYGRHTTSLGQRCCSPQPLMMCHTSNECDRTTHKYRPQVSLTRPHILQIIVAFPVRDTALDLVLWGKTTYCSGQFERGMKKWVLPLHFQR